MGYVKSGDETPLGYTAGIVQTQGSSLREQPWALRRKSVGVEDMDNKESVPDLVMLSTPNSRERPRRPSTHGNPTLCLQKCLTALPFRPPVLLLYRFPGPKRRWLGERVALRAEKRS